MNTIPSQTINSFEAAERQLKETIYLMFEKRDPVVIHTLAYAAHEILYQLGKPHNATSMIWNSMASKSQWKKEYSDAMRKAGNFFKHAGRNPKKKLEFKPQLTHFFICDAVRLYAQLTKKNLFFEGKVFNMWFTLTYPGTLEEEALIELVDKKIRPLVPSPSDFNDWLSFLKNHK
jgi:hypothetical protein